MQVEEGITASMQAVFNLAYGYQSRQTKDKEGRGDARKWHSSTWLASSTISLLMK
jgi:hypothetical protein